MATTIEQILMRRDTSTNWTANNPVLGQGEWGYETDTKLYKIGDGTTAWSTLLYEPNLTNDITTVGKVATLKTIAGVAGSYTNPNITVDSTGRITVVANGSGGSASIVTKTYSQLQSMVSGATLVAGQSYYISDKKIITTALSTTQLSNKGIYLYTNGKKSWGAFSIAGSSGNISQITIGSDNLLTATQNYSTAVDTVRVNPGWSTAPTVDITLLTLANAIASNINANGAINTKYKAYAVANGDVPASVWSSTGTYGKAYVIIGAISTGTALNGSSISVTSSTLTIASVTAMQGGSADLSTSLLYPCTYDFTNDRLLSLYDPLYNNLVEYDNKMIISDLPLYPTYLFDFNWNNPLVVSNKLTNCQITPNFILAGSSNNGGGIAMVSNELDGSTFGTNLIIAGEISYNKARSGVIAYNTINNASAGISGNDITGQIDKDYSTRYQSDISYNYISGVGILSNRLRFGASIRYCSETVSGYGITDNDLGYMTCMWNVTGWTAAKSNRLEARTQWTNLVSADYGILARVEVGDDSDLSNIKFTGITYFINNRLMNIGTMPSGAPVLQNWNNCWYAYTMAEDAALGANNLTRVSIITGDSICMNGITLVGASGNVINLHGQGASGYGHFSMDIQIQSFDGSNIGNIATQSLVSLKATNTNVISGYVYASGLTTSGTPSISLGINTTNNSIMTAKTTSTLNTGDGSHGTGMTALLGSGYANAATGYLPVTMTITNGSISAGLLIIHLECFRIDQ